MFSPVSILWLDSERFGVDRRPSFILFGCWESGKGRKEHPTDRWVTRTDGFQLVPQLLRKSTVICLEPRRQFAVTDKDDRSIQYWGVLVYPVFRGVLRFDTRRQLRQLPETTARLPSLPARAVSAQSGPIFVSFLSGFPPPPILRNPQCSTLWQRCHERECFSFFFSITNPLQGLKGVGSCGKPARKPEDGHRRDGEVRRYTGRSAKLPEADQPQIPVVFFGEFPTLNQQPKQRAPLSWKSTQPAEGQT